MSRTVRVWVTLVLGMVTVLPTFALFNRDNPYLEPTNDGSVAGVDVIGNDAGQQDAFVNVVRGAINWILGILALIALIIIMYGGFLMVTASGDGERYQKWFTILKQGAIGLILIGVAWFVVSIIFWLVNLVGGEAEGSDAGTGWS